MIIKLEPPRSSPNRTSWSPRMAPCRLPFSRISSRYRTLGPLVFSFTFRSCLSLVYRSSICWSFHLWPTFWNIVLVISGPPVACPNPDIGTQSIWIAVHNTSSSIMIGTLRGQSSSLLGLSLSTVAFLGSLVIQGHFHLAFHLETIGIGTRVTR
jgi:hypothetical protein